VLRGFIKEIRAEQIDATIKGEITYYLPGSEVVDYVLL
jgi:hypothetical protein